MSEQLLPCPFCGGEAKLEAMPLAAVGISPATTVFQVTCPCGVRAGSHWSAIGDDAQRHSAEAIAAWNRRAPPPAGLMLCSEDDLERVRNAEPGSLTPIYGIPAASRRTYDIEDRPVSPISHLNAEEGE